MASVAVVDGANVAFAEKSGDGKAKLGNLMKMKQALENKGYRTIIIVDAALRYEVDDPEMFDKLEKEGILRPSPAGTQADYFVLATAEREHAVIISDDRYQDYRDRFPGLEGKRIPFMIVDGNVILYCPQDKEGQDV